ncbi:MAG: sensor histidine kinase [Marmoricola sp.]
MRTKAHGELRRTSLRIGLQTGALVLGVLVVVGGVFWLLYGQAVDRAESSLLTNAAHGVDRPQEAPPGVWVTVKQHGQMQSSSDLPAQLPDRSAIAQVERDGGSVVSRVHGPDGTYLVRTERVGDRITQASLDLRDRQDESERVATAILFSAGVGVLLAAIVAAWLASRSVRPMAESLTRQRRFVADASHELRTPLTHLSMRVQLLSRRAARGEIAAADLAPVVADTHVLAEILDDLLAASDTRAQLREPTDIGALVRDACAAVAPFAHDRGIALRTDAPETITAPAVPTALRRAVTALVDNAVDHAGSSVDVTVTSSRRRVRIAVTDDGPGIAKDLMPHVFERFSGGRTGDSDRRHFGIGLALVADIAAAHRGSVDVRNREDGRSGTTFTLTLAAT